MIYVKIKYLPTNLNEQVLKFSTRFRSTLQTRPTTNHRSFFRCFPYFPPFHPSSSVSASRDFKGEVLTNATRTARKTSKKFWPVANPGYGVYSIYAFIVDAYQCLSSCLFLIQYSREIVTFSSILTRSRVYKIHKESIVGSTSTMGHGIEVIRVSYFILVRKYVILYDTDCFLPVLPRGDVLLL